MFKHFLLIAALAGPAFADDLPPLPDHAVTLGVIGHGGKIGAVESGGWGANLELSLGQHRWQYFVEGSLSRETLGPQDDRIIGHGLRGGGGVRWLARAFELGREGSIDMHLEAFAGMSRLSFDDKTISRPDLGFGVGYQVRGFHHHHQGALRISARIFFAPTDRGDAMTACRGSCPAPSGSDSSGLMALFGGQL